MEDGQRRVLLLTGDGSHVQLPSTALAGEDAVAVVGCLALVAVANGVLIQILMLSRLLYGMARRSLLPRRLTAVSAR